MMFRLRRRKETVGPFTLTWTAARGDCSLTITADEKTASLQLFMTGPFPANRLRGGVVLDRSRLRAYLSDVLKEL